MPDSRNNSGKAGKIRCARWLSSQVRSPLQLAAVPHRARGESAFPADKSDSREYNHGEFLLSADRVLSEHRELARSNKLESESPPGVKFVLEHRGGWDGLNHLPPYHRIAGHRHREFALNPAAMLLGSNYYFCLLPKLSQFLEAILRHLPKR